MERQIDTRDGAFEAMYDRNFRHVLAYCGRRLPSSDAADAAADTFLVAWRRFAEMPDGERERPWLYGVAYRVISNQRRSTSRRGRLTERLRTAGHRIVDDAAVQVVRAESHREVLNAIDRLEPLDREVLMLSLWEELSSPEIAETLGISEAAIRKRKSRARRRLQRLLKPTKDSGIVIPITDAEGDTHD